MNSNQSFNFWLRSKGSSELAELRKKWSESLGGGNKFIKFASGKFSYHIWYNM